MAPREVGDQAASVRRTVVIAIGENASDDLGDVLLAGSLARQIGASVTVVAVIPRWDAWLRRLAIAGLYLSCPAPRSDLLCAAPELRERLAGLFDLVGVPWRLIDECGSRRAAADRVARHLPGCLVFHPEPCRAPGRASAPRASETLPTRTRER